tara:strand:+ start:212 stop:754 length:543 start_codon:yes stop_codon:yes gene_type:complete
MNKVVILDRDGTLIKHIPYLHDPSKVSLLPGVKVGIQNLMRDNIVIYIHTNQSGINRGYFNYSEAVKCNEALINLLGFGSKVFQSICIAPEMPGEDSLYRKPSPNFGLEILKENNITKDKLFYIGDSLCDLMTAHKIGCKGVGVNTGIKKLTQQVKGNDYSDKYPIFDSFSEAVLYVISD